MTKTSKILAAAAIIALLGAGCAKPSANANKPAPGASRGAVASGTLTVKIMPNGEFEPVTAFVKKGTVVTFRNATAYAHSVVPVEDTGDKKKFDGLDSKGSIAPNGKFSVTMSQAGRWLYADGTNSAFSGAIEVVE